MDSDKRDNDQEALLKDDLDQEAPDFESNG